MTRAQAALLALLAGCGSAPPAADADKVTLPPYPREAGLIEFSPGAGSMRFFIDAPSLSVAEGVVRYTLVARSPEGARNVSYESMSCATGRYRVHALGQSDGSWGAREGEWRPASDYWHRSLYREYFCAQNEPIRSREEGERALRSGGHPFAKGLGG